VYVFLDHYILGVWGYLLQKKSIRVRVRVLSFDPSIVSYGIRFRSQGYSGYISNKGIQVTSLIRTFRLHL